MSKNQRPKELLLFNGEKLRAEDLLQNPQTSNRYFGYISDVKGYHDGYIVLKWGIHRGYHKGFGCMHIWIQHQADFRVKRLCSAIEEVPNVINRILQPGTPIIERNDATGRLAVLRSSTGTLILECPKKEGDYYSIVTVYLKKAYSGTVIGSVKRLPQSNAFDGFGAKIASPQNLEEQEHSA